MQNVPELCVRSESCLVCIVITLWLQTSVRLLSQVIMPLFWNTRFWLVNPNTLWLNIFTSNLFPNISFIAMLGSCFLYHYIFFLLTYSDNLNFNQCFMCKKQDNVQSDYVLKWKCRLYDFTIIDQLSVHYPLLITNHLGISDKPY